MFLTLWWCLNVVVVSYERHVLEERRGHGPEDGRPRLAVQTRQRPLTLASRQCLQQVRGQFRSRSRI
jgi:hypothetical protein